MTLLQTWLNSYPNLTASLLYLGVAMVLYLITCFVCGLIRGENWYGDFHEDGDDRIGVLILSCIWPLSVAFVAVMAIAVVIIYVGILPSKIGGSCRKLFKKGKSQ